MAEYIALVAALLMILWVIYFAKKTSKEMGPGYAGCIFCGVPCAVEPKPDAVKKAEDIFQGSAKVVVICENCAEKNKRR